MKQTKKITLSAMAVALGVAFMAIGAFIEAADLAVSAISSAIMVFIFVEVGKPYTYCVWLGTAFLSFVFFPYSFAWVSYLLVFGIYPIIKAYIERMRRGFWVILKFLFFNAVAPLMILASEYLLGIPFFDDDVVIPFLSEYTVLLKIGVYLALLGALFIYDICMTVMIRSYFSFFRRKIERILKRQ